MLETKPTSSQWGASEALLLEGLEGLCQQFGTEARPPSHSDRKGEGPEEALISRSVRPERPQAPPSPFRAVGAPADDSSPEASKVQAKAKTNGGGLSEARYRLSQQLIEAAPSPDEEDQVVSSSAEDASPESVALASARLRPLSARRRQPSSELNHFTPPQIRPLISETEEPNSSEESPATGKAPSNEVPVNEVPANEAPRSLSRRRQRREARLAEKRSTPSKKAASSPPSPEAQAKMAEALPARVMMKSETGETKRPAASAASETAPPSPKGGEAAPEASPEGQEGPQRAITPQLEPTVRRRRTRSSFFPAVMTALFLTSLVWGGLLLSCWTYIGDEWFSDRVEEETASMEGRLEEAMRTTRTELTDAVHSAQEQMVLLRARHEQFVRLNALEAGMYSDHSRQKFDDLMEIGDSLPTGTSEQEFYKQTKSRIETAYARRLRQHPGLNVRALFPKLNLTRETSLGKSTLMKFIGESDANGWDRARAAMLLQRYLNDDETIAFLIRTIRDEADLQVVLAAWDSLVALTGYEPGSKGFSPSDFDRWWSTRPVEG